MYVSCGYNLSTYNYWMHLVVNKKYTRILTGMFPSD